MNRDPHLFSETKLFNGQPTTKDFGIVLIGRGMKLKNSFPFLSFIHLKLCPVGRP